MFVFLSWLTTVRILGGCYDGCSDQQSCGICETFVREGHQYGQVSYYDSVGGALRGGEC